MLCSHVPFQSMSAYPDWTHTCAASEQDGVFGPLHILICHGLLATAAAALLTPVPGVPGQAVRGAA